MTYFQISWCCQNESRTACTEIDPEYQPLLEQDLEELRAKTKWIGDSSSNLGGSELMNACVYVLAPRE